MLAKNPSPGAEVTKGDKAEASRTAKYIMKAVTTAAQHEPRNFPSDDDDDDDEETGAFDDEDVAPKKKKSSKKREGSGSEAGAKKRVRA
jgi:hypothetical protein